MNPDEVFNRFNEIIGPNFSLITGRRLVQQHTDCDSGGDIGSDRRCGLALGDTAFATSSHSSPGKSGKETDGVVAEAQNPPSHANVARDTCWTLIRPKELVLIKHGPGTWTKADKKECVLVTNIEERAAHDDDDHGGDYNKRTHILQYVRASHDGRRFSPTKNFIEIGSSSHGIVDIAAEDLGVIPMRLFPISERQNIETRLVSRGKKYHSICESSHNFMHYEGPVIPLGQDIHWTSTTNQRVMVDGKAARMVRAARVHSSLIVSSREQSLKAFLSNEGHPMPPSGETSSSQGEDLSGDDALPGAKGKHKSSEYEKTSEDHEWTDIDYLTCPPTLVVFLLDENIWANVHVEHLTDIVWPERPFDSLELETGKKELLQNLIRRFKTKEVSEGWRQDTRGGQGGNLILFLSGPPGVGKTLTAEVVAEEAQRPLNRMAAGGLSIDPSALEKQLGDIFLLARRWGAIILIDEADMFMTKRQASTPNQNAAVTAFLRLLHAYDGLIFLTSTSEDIDTAFYDRIHATIKYVGLDETQRTNIWRRQLQRAVGSPAEHLPNSRWPEETYRLLGKVETDGRDIRNIVRTAEQLALGLSTNLAMKHVAAAMRNFGGSDNYVESICKKLEALEEKVGKGRAQACDDNVELQQSIGGRSDRL